MSHASMLRLWLGLLLLGAADAGAVDPALRWFTLETPHFRVHFHEGAHMEALAQRTAYLCEAAHEILSPKLRWSPTRKTEVVLSDDIDSANGSAFTLFRPWMKLYAEVPEDLSVLNDFDDHLWILIAHEYTHVLHLDTVTGIPDAVNAVFGQLLIPNAYVPRWLTEGLATYEESNVSNAGRLRSSLFDMWLRTSVLRRPFDLASVTHTPQDWPRGNLAYLYGGHFMAFVAQEVGEDALPAYFNLYGGRLIPFSLNDTAEQTWKSSFVSLYERWLSQTQAKYTEALAPVRAAGLTPFQQLTSAGFGTGQPHFTHDGSRIVYLEAGPDRRPQLRWMRADGTDDRLIRELWAGGTLDLSPDDRRIVISLPEVFEEYAVYEDLYELEIASGRLDRFTEGLRATSPTWSPDGERIAFVGRSGGGHSYLGVWDRKDGRIRRYVDSGPRERLYTPEFTPDGQSVVFAQQAGPGRRLASVALATGEVRTWLESPWIISEPAFAPDGRLLFSTDRTGIYNLHALDPGTGDLQQLTNFETGGFHPSPSPDGRQVAFAHYSVDGYDVGILNLADRTTATLPPRPPREGPRPPATPATPLPVSPYSPLRSMAPLYWLPLLGQDARGLTLGIVTGGADVLDRHTYTLQGSWGLTSNEPGFYAGYSNRTFHPGIDVYATTAVSQSAGFPTGFYDRQWAAGAQMTLPRSTLDSRTSLSLGYELRYYDPQFRVRLEPDQPRPSQPRRGTTGVVSASLAFSNARGFADSISSEEGHGFAATLRHSGPYTLGTFAFTSSDVRYHTYLRMPWLEHHVLALQLAAGSAWGEIGNRPVYSFGGIGVADPILQLLNGQRVGSGALRGYGPRAVTGNTFVFGTLEYRFPLWVLDEGVDALPFYVRRLHGAVFSDAAATGRRALELSGEVHPSAGAELRADVILGYALNTTLRLGGARGFGPGGITSIYLTLGSSF